MTKSQCVKILVTIGIILAAFLCTVARGEEGNEYIDACEDYCIRMPTYTCPKHGEITYCDVIYIGCEDYGPYCLKCIGEWMDKHAQKVEVK